MRTPIAALFRRNAPDRLRPIGLPRALHPHLQPGLWETFFGALGVPVVLSAPTTRAMFERAELISETEHCLPVKLLDAHLDNLAGRVDRVFVPRILSLRRGFISCPKLAALPDAVRAQFRGRFEVVTADMDENRRPLEPTLVDLGRALGFAPAESVGAAQQALAAAGAPDAPPAGKRFLLIGHPYNLGDAYLTGPIVRKLEDLGAVVERLPAGPPRGAPAPLRWDTSAHMLEALRALDPARCAGVIQLTSFNCGCDSMAGPYYRETLKAAGIPFMALTLDSHTALAGLDTRLEAFVESIAGRA
ncbi:MAG TPA: acyl-CoA dehydratase activase-related protein [Kiritimatiellia bacterium]|nr:acyl-CoA dehydratase activase-related protein [Kiritimatiellia bacterium]